MSIAFQWPHKNGEGSRKNYRKLNGYRADIGPSRVDIQLEKGNNAYVLGYSNPMWIKASPLANQKSEYTP